MVPLAGLVTWEFSAAPAAAFAGRLLSDLGAVVRVFDVGDRGTRGLPPFDGGRSLLHAYVSEGKAPAGCVEDEMPRGIESVHIVLHDGFLPAAWAEAIERTEIPERGRVVASVTPYGQTGPKSDWLGCELTLFQAGGEGFLMPSGLPFELFPDRPPIGVGRYVAHYQAGLTVALALIAGLRVSRRRRITEWVDVSIQDAQLSLNYFTVARHVDGAPEDRANRGFKYGGVLRCRDGYVEILTLEQSQWEGLVRMMDEPAWASEERFKDPIARGRHGHEINVHLRAWAASRTTSEVVDAAVREGVPCGSYVEPGDLTAIPQLQARGFFGGPPAELRPGSPWIVSRAEGGVAAR